MSVCGAPTGVKAGWMPPGCQRESGLLADGRCWMHSDVPAAVRYRFDKAVRYPAARAEPAMRAPDISTQDTLLRRYIRECAIACEEFKRTVL